MNSAAFVKLGINETLFSTWHKVAGSKATIWSALGLFILIGFGFAILTKFAFSVSPTLGMLFVWLKGFINYFLYMGLIYIGLRRGQNLPIQYIQIFHPMKPSLIFSLIGLSVLMMLLFLPFFILLFSQNILVMIIMAGFPFLENFSYSFLLTLAYLFTVIGMLGLIYLNIRLLLAYAFIFDQNEKPWTAIKLSFTATQGNFWQLLGIYFIALLFFAASILTVVGLIWSIPFILIIYGTVYQRLANQHAITQS